MNKLLENASEVIRAAGAGPLAFATLIVLVLSGIGTSFFLDAPVEIQIGIFFLLFLAFGVAGFTALKVWRTQVEAAIQQGATIPNQTIKQRKGKPNKPNHEKTDSKNESMYQEYHKTKSHTLYCSFCGKSQHEVHKLIAGPAVFICDECSELCFDIVDESYMGMGERSEKVSQICELSFRVLNQDLSDSERADIRGQIQELCGKVRSRFRERQGDTVANCLLQRVIGSGNFATVWEAKYLGEAKNVGDVWDLKSEARVADERKAYLVREGDRVAVKIFDQNKLGIGLMLWRFLRGIRAQKHLTQLGDFAPKSIVRIFDVGDDLLSFSMQYLPAGDLESIEKFGWDHKKKLKIFEQVAEAIEFSHSQGIVHRDIKPANVVLDEDHNAVLTDFDIADLKFAATQSVYSGSLGTPQFAAPEQLIDVSPISDPTADIYSLGKFLYFLMQEEAPPLGSSESDRIPNYLLKIEDHSVREIINKCIKYDPKERFQTVGDLRNELK